MSALHPVIKFRLPVNGLAIVIFLAQLWGSLRYLTSVVNINIDVRRDVVFDARVSGTDHGNHLHITQTDQGSSCFSYRQPARLLTVIQWLDIL